MMTRYKVYCGMRKAGNFPAMTDEPTIFRVVFVDAPSIGEARTLAIYECYAQDPTIEHVKPLRVTEVVS